MRIDWDNVKDQLCLIRDDIRHRPEARRRLAVAGAVVIALAAVGIVWITLPGGEARPVKQAKAAPPGGAPIRPAPSLGGAKEFADELTGRLRSDPRFRDVAATHAVGADGRSGRVMLMGQLTRRDLDDLRALVARLNPPVPIDWRIIVP